MSINSHVVKSTIVGALGGLLNRRVLPILDIRQPRSGRLAGLFQRDLAVRADRAARGVDPGGGSRHRCIAFPLDRPIRRRFFNAARRCSSGWSAQVAGRGNTGSGMYVRTPRKSHNSIVAAAW